MAWVTASTELPLGHLGEHQTRIVRSNEDFSGASRDLGVHACDHATGTRPLNRVRVLVHLVLVELAEDELEGFEELTRQGGRAREAPGERQADGLGELPR